MEASQSPSVANSGDLLRQSSTVSMEVRNGSGALQVLRAAAARADKWKAANVDSQAGWLSLMTYCFCFRAGYLSPATIAVSIFVSLLQWCVSCLLTVFLQ